jgi:SAM-dependent methyltransferase
VLYRKDLATIHDAGFADVARSAAPFLLTALAGAGLEEGLVVDLGCGSGVFAKAITAEGYDVIGIDVSPAMLRMARKRVPAATFRRGSLHDVEIPQAVAVTGIGEAFNYFLRRPHSERGLARLFRKVHRALVPGGILLFDMAAPGRLPGGGPAKTHFEAEDWAILVTAEERNDVLTRRITSFRRNGSRYRRSEEIHRQRLFARPVVLRLLREVGFRVRPLPAYGDFRLPRGWVAYFASKTTSGRSRSTSSSATLPPQ